MTALFWWLAALAVAVLVIWAARREHNERKAMRAAVLGDDTLAMVAEERVPTPLERFASKMTDAADIVIPADESGWYRISANVRRGEQDGQFYLTDASVAPLDAEPGPADLDALADHIAGIVRDVVATCEADAEDARNAMQYAIHPVGRERFHAEVESFLKEQS